MYLIFIKYSNLFVDLTHWSVKRTKKLEECKHFSCHCMFFSPFFCLHLPNPVSQFCQFTPRFISWDYFLCSDLSGYFGWGRYGEYDDAWAHRGPGSRRWTLHGDNWSSGAPGPGISYRPDAQALTAILPHPRRAEEEEERSQQSAQTATQQTTGSAG